ncbi:DUF5368 domain-containing protein [Rhodobacteraceae bacterium 2376]|uniref:DUF5368 domain-containing protein n=1 Tax=Rhabdonatronobacter sediminivivens TaxID=2743469 RepID=A0A7Z0KW23_9RHOB|nr:DUF5368 domain-containing protein [Rhabdonatronobacter sediminivivens]NYS23360.1 DUF5368 domain-containing protein [Rhabdonatronobacter sediminivivens]
MEEFSLLTMIAVFEEMFGIALFWIMVSVAVVITAAWVFVLVRDRSLSFRKYLVAQLSMPFGAVAAVWFVLWITNSGLADIGGPIDWLVLLGVAALGAVGLGILVYVVQSLMRGRQSEV